MYPEPTVAAITDRFGQHAFVLIADLQNDKIGVPFCTSNGDPLDEDPHGSGASYILKENIRHWTPHRPIDAITNSRAASELTAIGEQYVIPGAERVLDAGPDQLELWGRKD